MDTGKKCEINAKDKWVVLRKYALPQDSRGLCGAASDWSTTNIGQGTVYGRLVNYAK